ncbi:MAG: hypothetical protein HZC54_06195 [Verrucomicrobia bacterium]|nr:hypothetical protein [Verrucomicrobiota bacterium]
MLSRNSLIVRLPRYSNPFSHVAQFAWQGARLHLQSARPMSQQYNKKIKQRRRKAYIKRKREALKQRAAKKPGAKPAAAAETAKPAA